MAKWTTAALRSAVAHLATAPTTATAGGGFASQRQRPALLDLLGAPAWLNPRLMKWAHFG
jgi:hypothetical protein